MAAVEYASLTARRQTAVRSKWPESMKRFCEVLAKAPRQKGVAVVCPHGIVLVRDKATGKTIYSEPFDRQLATYTELVLKRAEQARLRALETLMKNPGKPSPTSRRG